jgi:hypothetical protein
MYGLPAALGRVALTDVSAGEYRVSRRRDPLQKETVNVYD